MPVAFNAVGTATITVTVMDNGGTANGGNVVTQTFAITVAPVNQVPTLAPINPPSVTIAENTTTPQTIILTGIKRRASMSRRP